MSSNLGTSRSSHSLQIESLDALLRIRFERDIPRPEKIIIHQVLDDLLVAEQFLTEQIRGNALIIVDVHEQRGTLGMNVQTGSSRTPPPLASRTSLRVFGPQAAFSASLNEPE